MPRIRSLHPGQTTDGAFVRLSPFARLLALHIRCWADDQGVFKWDTVELKMEIFPADSVDIDALLEELVEHNHVKKYEVGGKQYGAIRNFQRWQKPKSPKAVFPLPPEFRNYVTTGEVNSAEVEPDQCSKDDISEKGGNEPSSTEPISEIAPQMEEGGGNREDVGGTPPVPSGHPPHRGGAPPSDDSDLLSIPKSMDRRRATRLPDDWTLPMEWRAWAISEGFSEAQAIEEGKNFADYWCAKGGEKARKTDWFRTWKRWVRTALQRLRAKAPAESSDAWSGVDA